MELSVKIEQIKKAYKSLIRKSHRNQFDRDIVSQLKEYRAFLIQNGVNMDKLMGY